MDVYGGAFRLINHTAFDRYAVSLLEQAGCDGVERLAALVGV